MKHGRAGAPRTARPGTGAGRARAAPGVKPPAHAPEAIAGAPGVATTAGRAARSPRLGPGVREVDRRASSCHGFCTSLRYRDDSRTGASPAAACAGADTYAMGVLRLDELIAIVGMHRSGTSLTAHLVHELGVTALGVRTGLVRADAFNSRGYWESADLISVNTYLCNYLGCDWRHPLVPPNGWERSPQLVPLRRRLERLIATQPAARRSLKDPRMTVTLPFWQSLVPHTATVVCLRSPLAVARSLERREGMQPHWAVGLWALHTALAVRHAKAGRRLFVAYEDLLADGGGEAERIARFVGVAARRAEAAAGAVVAPQLSHSGAALDREDALGNLGRAGERAARLWRAALDARAADWRPAAVAALDAAADGVLAAPPVPTPSGAFRRRHRARFLVKSLRMLAASVNAPPDSLILPGNRAFGHTRRVVRPEEF